jgi:hypothetical protein
MGGLNIEQVEINTIMLWRYKGADYSMIYKHNKEKEL